MREIPLVNAPGMVTLVDDSDYSVVSQYSWHLNKQRHTSYARATIANGKRVYLHKFLLPDAPRVDHISGDGLDNRRENLRVATHQQNMQNQSAQGERIYKGVTQRSAECWIAFLKIGSVQYHLGTFPSPELAAHAYDEMAYAAFGEFARLNFPDRAEEYRWRARISCYYPDGRPVVPDV